MLNTFFIILYLLMVIGAFCTLIGITYTIYKYYKVERSLTREYNNKRLQEYQPLLEDLSPTSREKLTSETSRRLTNGFYRLIVFRTP